MLRIPRKIDYTIRVLMELEKGAKKAPLSLKIIAERNNIPEKYLKQIMPYLEARKIVKSVKGPGGGYMLSRSLKDISLYDIFDALQGEVEIVPCIRDDKFCFIADKCLTKSIWVDLNKKINNFLKKKKIHKILEEG